MEHSQKDKHPDECKSVGCGMSNAPVPVKLERDNSNVITGESSFSMADKSIIKAEQSDLIKEEEHENAETATMYEISTLGENSTSKSEASPKVA